METKEIEITITQDGLIFSDWHNKDLAELLCQVCQACKGWKSKERKDYCINQSIYCG